MSFFGKDEILDGTFSPAGKASAEKYHIINHANIIHKKEKKKIIKDSLIPDLSWEEDTSNEKEKVYSFEDFRKAQTPNQRAKIKKDIKKYFKDHMDKIYRNKLNKKSNIIKNKTSINDKYSTPRKRFDLNINSKNNIENTFYIKGLTSPLTKYKYKYHNNHMMKLLKMKQFENNKNNSKNKEPIYNPKLEYIYNKIKVGPNWKKLSGRKNKLFGKLEKSLDKYYNNAYNLVSTHCSFIDMAKQTQRNGFPINHNLRQRYETKFKPVDNKEQDIKWKKICKSPLISKSPFSRDNHEYKLKMILRCNKDKTFYTNYRANKDKFLSYEKCKSIPDFNRCLSREYLQKLERKKFIESNEMYYPKYNSVKERVKMMVVYNIDKNKKNNYKFKGIDSNELFNVTDSFEKIYGHKLKVVPIFEKMMARPKDKILPSFMKEIYNKMGSYLITDKTLKLNNYSNGDMHYNIYKNNNKNTKKQEELLENTFDTDFLNEQNNKENSKTLSEINNNNIKRKKMKKEIENEIKKMNKLYYEYQNRGKS